MEKLKALIAIRILDFLGVISKETMDIRNEAFLIKDIRPNIYSGKVQFSESEVLVFIYTEVNECKYMISFVQNEKDIGDTILCIVVGDLESQSYDMNKLIVNNKNKFREPSYFEAAKFLCSFETIRNHIPHWDPNEPTNEQIEILFNFTKALGMK